MYLFIDFLEFEKDRQKFKDEIDGMNKWLMLVFIKCLQLLNEEMMCLFFDI